MATFDTTAPAQVKGLGTYSVDPLFTVGETINGYTPPGILDGTGAYKLNSNTVRILVNHELASNVGYAYTLANGTSLTGARVSYFDIDISTQKIVGTGLAYNTIYNRAGEVVDAASDLEFSGLNRFCSANFIPAQQFGSGIGFVDNIFFTGEETDGGTEFALDVATNTLWALPWLGRAAWESVTEINTGLTDKVALLIGDDRAPAPMLLYVGTKDTSAGASFLARNGLNNGKLYVWVADDLTDTTDPIELNPTTFRGTGASRKGRFVEIPYYVPSLAGQPGYDAQGFATQAQQDALATAANAFFFSRPEDVATNPTNGAQAVMASTGRGQLFGGVDNWGTTYQIDFNFANLAAITGDVKVLYDGDDAGTNVLNPFTGPDFGLRSPDNLDWTDDGFIYIQEDRSTNPGSLFGGTSGQEASIWRLDPTATNPAATLTRVAQIDRTGVPAGQTDSAPADRGNWETSGILDVSTLFGANPGELLLFDVQAHSLTGTPITASPAGSLVEGGQLSILSPYADTAAPSQAKGLNGYTVNPIFTVGETINGYTPPGILDGIGAYAKDANTVRVLVNHELANNVGYAYTLTSGKSLTGARISYFDIDKNTLKVVGSGLAYDTIYNRAGQQVTTTVGLDTVNDNGINRFCSGILIDANKFGAGRGFVDTIYFAGEETTGGTEFALDVVNGDLWAVPWLGRAAWENVTEVDTGTTDKIALLVGDDRSSANVNGATTTPVAPILLYVGTKSTAANANFLQRNGLADGKLYVWVADDPTNPTDAIETTPVDFFQTGASLRGKFVEISIYNPAQANSAVDGPDTGTSIQDGERGFDSLGFATQGEQDAQVLAAQAFRFSRPEDVATNPNDGTQVVLASTGNGANPTDDTWGTTYKIDIDFNNINTGDITAKVDILYAGDDTGNGAFANPDASLRSPDNLDWADDGLIYLQEDDAVDVTPGFGGTSGQEASIWRLDPNAANPAASLTRVAQIDRTALPPTQTDASPTDIGNWETSGILDVSELFGRNPGDLLIFDVQAHGLRDGSIIGSASRPAVDTDGDGNPNERTDNLVEGGQLSFLVAPQDTAAPAQMKGLNGYSVDPVLTVGESVHSYTPVGILDGLGAYEKDAQTVRVLANHELASNRGYAYTLANGTSITGARVSYFDIDKSTRRIVGAGLAYSTVYDRTGAVVTDPNQINEQTDPNSTRGFDRFCSSTLIEANQFGSGRGLADRLYFTGEETSTVFGHPHGGTEWVLDAATGDLWALPDFGRGTWENVTELDTGTTDKVAFLLGDDFSGAPMYLYVGTKNAGGANVLERNGLTGGKMYVWVADDPSDAADAVEADPSQFKGTGNQVKGKWVEIQVRDASRAGQTGFDAQGYKDDVTLRADAVALGAFQFSRPEDLATNPTDGTQAVLASTGFGSLFNGADNWGTTYLFDTDFNNINGGDITASVKILYDGDDAGNGIFSGPDFGLRSADNLDWADDGLIYIQEDRSTSPGSLFGGASGEEASIWRLDPHASNPAATLTRVAQIDRTAVPTGQTDSRPTDLGNWESSGILDVSTLFGEDPGELFLFDVQAHSLTGGGITNQDLAEGGQLAFLSAPFFNTSAPPQIKGLNGYTTEAAFTVGETIEGYAPVGILDGIGAYAKDANTIRILVNHELGSNAGYGYSLANGTQMTGARVSYFDIDKTSRNVVGAGLAYSKVYDRTGALVTDPNQVNEQSDPNSTRGFDRFCSSTLIEANQFGSGRGLADRLYFAGEETSTVFGHPHGGSEWVLDVATGDFWALPDFGRGTWENVTELDTGTTDKVAFLLGDDFAPAPLYLYVGTKNANGANVLERNGLTGGKMYIWVADDPASTADAIEADPSQFKGTGNSLAGKWVEVQVRDASKAGQTGYDAQGYKDDVTLRADAVALGAFVFSRPEDLATNPFDGTQAVMASTGRGQLFGGADNWGTTYLIDTDFKNINGGDIRANIDILYDADDAGTNSLNPFSSPDAGLRSADNLDWADDGLIYIQEDRSTNPGSAFGGTSGEEASVWRLDPTAPNPALTLTRVAQIDRSAVPTGQTDSAPTDLGNWESSGILDVSTLFGEDPGELFILDVQAHSLTGGPITSQILAEGGQLTFLKTNRAAVDFTFDNGNGVFSLGSVGGVTSVLFTLTERNSTNLNEIGIVVVDDANGTINGLAPGQAGYTEAALARSRALFSEVEENFLDNSTRLLQLTGGQEIVFYLVRNSTADSVLAGQTPTSDVLFSSTVSSLDVSDLGNNSFSIGFEDGGTDGSDFNDVVIEVQLSSQSTALGTNLQGQTEGELVDLSDEEGQFTVTAEVFREAAFNNIVGFYEIDDASGSANGLTPGATGFDRTAYIQNAINNRISNLDLQTSDGTPASFTGTFDGRSLLAPFIIVNGTIADALSGAAQVYFPFIELNSDGADHVRLLGDNTFGFEDLPGGGDQDFEDVVVKLTLTQV